MPENTKRILPNFLIVGAAKSGTTSLYYYLKQHPQVFMPEWKEPSFFADAAAGGVTKFSKYAELFNSVPSSCLAVGEASVAYLYDPDAAKNIKEVLSKDVHIIILLRNPVDMAYSLWGHMKRVGAENLNFSAAVKEENTRARQAPDGRFNHEWVGNFLYLSRAMYSSQIAQYQKHFDEKHLHIYIYEEFFAELDKHMRKIYEPLGLDYVQVDDTQSYNQAGGVRSVAVQNFLRRPSSLKGMIKKLLPIKGAQYLRDTLNRYNRVNAPLPPMSDDCRKELEKHFYSDVRLLEKCLGRSLAEIWF